jgi:hypothetical protein
MIIRLIPGICLAALKKGLDKELALWFCLRSLNTSGCGALDQEIAVSGLVREFGYSKSTVYRVLRQGEGIFWGKHRKGNTYHFRIQIYGLNSVAASLGAYCGRHHLEITAEEFGGHRGHRLIRQRAWLYSTIHKPAGDKATPMYRVVIENETGLGRRRQQRYDKLSSTSEGVHANREDTNGHQRPVLDEVKGKWWVHRQFGNVYHSKAQKSHRGQLKKVNAALGRSLYKGEARHGRRFFTSVEQYKRCHNRHPDPFLLVRSPERIFKGRIEYCAV